MTRVFKAPQTLTMGLGLQNSRLDIDRMTLYALKVS